MSLPGCAIRSEHFAAFVLALAYGTAGAQDVDARLKALETQLDALKKRVEVLEGGGFAPAGSEASPADCARWDRLRMNMTEGDVRSVIGAPTKIDATPLQSRWRYPCGTAYFDAETKRFVGWER